MLDNDRSGTYSALEVEIVRLTKRVFNLEQREHLIRDVIDEARRTHHFVGAHAVRDLLIALENVLNRKDAL